MANKWISVAFKFFEVGESLYRVEPTGFYIGLYDVKNNLFVFENDSIIESAVSFLGDNLNKTYFAFPIKINESVRESYQLHNFVSKYMSDIKKYNHFCSVQEKGDETVNNFYSMKSDCMVCEPLYFDWKLPFQEQTIDSPVLTPSFNFNRKELISKMKERIVAQDEQIETFVTTVLSNLKYGGYQNLKDNIFIIGSTGTGKTEMCKTLANLLSIPIIKKDITKYTSSGYKGLDVLTILDDLCAAANYDIDSIEHGIIVLDEFDKLGRSEDNGGSGVRSTSVQEELLGLLGNDTYDVNIKGQIVSINTSNITFVLVGACQRLFESKSNKSNTLGFNSSCDKSDEPTNRIITKEDLINEIGLEPELLGRVPVIIQTNELKPVDLKKILTSSSINNFRLWSDAFLNEDGVKLVASDEVLTFIANKAYGEGGGARGLQNVVTNTLSGVKGEILDGSISNCDVILGTNTVNDPSKFLVKKKGCVSNGRKLSECDG